MAERKLRPPEERKAASRNGVRERQRQMKWRQEQFIAALKRLGTDTHAAEATDITIACVEKWKREDVEFVAEYEKANRFVTDVLIRSGLQRASTGWLEPVFQGGKQVGQVRKYSDRCWEILLKGRDKNFQGLDKMEIPLRFVDEVVAKVMLAINKQIPETCPHCKSNLHIRPELVAELKRLSASMGAPKS